MTLYISGGDVFETVFRRAQIKARGTSLLVGDRPFIEDPQRGENGVRSPFFVRQQSEISNSVGFGVLRDAPGGNA
jgi:hypothetical protein